MDLSPYDSLGRFVDGDFASGIVKNISLPTGCWTMAFSTRAEILATGLRNRVEFLEARNFTLLYSLPQKDKVSAIHWCPGSAFSPTACTQKSCKNIMPHHSRLEDGELVAVAGLDGHVGVYHLDASLLELKGTQIIHEFEVGGQVRCMAFKSMRQGGALLAVGDKQGKITLVTLYRDNSVGHILATVPIVVDFEGDAVLCLDCHLGDNPILAAGTKSGKVVIHELLLSTAKIGISYMVCGKEIWRTERNGNVRAVVISDDGIYLSFGGYDKTLIRVNVRLLAIVRELTLEGTINTIAFDPLDRFMVVGCRDKSLTIFDTSTYFPIKRLQTPGWVTVRAILSTLHRLVSGRLTFSATSRDSPFRGDYLASGLTS